MAEIPALAFLPAGSNLTLTDWVNAAQFIRRRAAGHSFTPVCLNSLAETWVDIVGFRASELVEHDLDRGS